MSFPFAFSAFMIVSYRDMFNLLMQLGMAIDSYSTTQNLYIGRGSNIYLVSCAHPFWKGSGHEANIYHRYGNRGPHIYVVLGTGSPILYSYGEPIHVGRGPHIYHRYGWGSHIYVHLGTGSPILYSFGDPGSPLFT